MENLQKELIEGLKAIERLCDSDNPTHENIWRIASSLIKSSATKARAVSKNEQTKEVCEHSYETYSTAVGIYQTCRNCGHTRG